MLTLFKSIVLSRIDYASQLWSPYKRAVVVVDPLLPDYWGESASVV